MSEPKEPFDQSKAVGGATRDAVVAGGISTMLVTLLGQLGWSIPPEFASAVVTVAIFGWRYFRAWWKHGDVVNF